MVLKAESPLVPLLVVLIATSIAVIAAQYYQPPAKNYRPTAWQYVEQLGVGLAVNWLNYPRVQYYYFYWRARGVSIPEMIRDMGFTHVRIRVSGDIARDRAALERLETVIQDCLKAGLIPVVAYTARELRENPENKTIQQHFINWWATLAEKLENTSHLVAFDLITETSGKLKDKYQILNNLYKRTIEVIRSIDPYRIIIVTPPDASSPFSAEKLDIEYDQYTILEWHIYAGGPKKKDNTYYNKTLVERAVETILEWSEKHRTPVYMGAWRPNRYPKHPKERLPDGAPKPLYSEKIALEFSKYMTTILCSHKIPFTLNADTLYIDYTKPAWFPSQKQLVQAIIETCTKTMPGNGR